MSLSSCSDLDYILETLQEWYADVSGVNLTAKHLRSQDEYLNLEKKLRAKVKQTRQIQEKRNEMASRSTSTNIEIIKMTEKVKLNFSELEGMLKQLNSILGRQMKNEAKYGAENLSRKRKVRKNFRKILDRLVQGENEVREVKGGQERDPGYAEFDNINFGKF